MTELREVPFEEAQALASQFDVFDTVETSAKDCSNVEEAFAKVASELMLRHGGPMFNENVTDSIKLNSKDVGESWGCGC